MARDVCSGVLVESLHVKLREFSQYFTGRGYDVKKNTLPRTGYSGEEVSVDTMF
jgi:hypothetical protein